MIKKFLSCKGFSPDLYLSFFSKLAYQGICLFEISVKEKKYSKKIGE